MLSNNSTSCIRYIVILYYIYSCWKLKLIYAEKNPGPRFRLYSREFIGNLATREPDNEEGKILLK